MEQLGAGSRPEGVQAFSETSLELVRPHGWEATPLRGPGSLALLESK